MTNPANNQLEVRLRAWYVTFQVTLLTEMFQISRIECELVPINKLHFMRISGIFFRLDLLEITPCGEAPVLH